MTLELDPMEIDALREALDAHLHELLSELVRTEQRDYRADLVTAYERLQRVLTRIERAAEQGEAVPVP